ncbi:NADPH-dependent FMN reductase [Ancylomarina sp. YFZ004]
MKKIAGISTSSSSKSINRELLSNALNQIDQSNTSVIDLNQNLPIYSIDIEEQHGIPNEIQELFTKLQSYDAYIIAIPEHNGSITALFKNTLDWLSRIDQNIFGKKDILLLSTSPGPNGGKYAIAHVKIFIPFLGGNVVSDFSLGSFYDNYQNETITDKQMNLEYTEALNHFRTVLV